MKKLLIPLVIILVSCSPRKPDYVDRFGNEYKIVDSCVVSHKERFTYTYMMKVGKSMIPTTQTSYRTVCDSVVKDTVEINLDKRYYPY